MMDEYHYAIVIPGEGVVIRRTECRQVTESVGLTDTFRRPDYTLEQAALVADWLNGDDQPLRDMVARRDDPKMSLWSYNLPPLFEF
jgi:hypothetical protein